MIDRSMTRDTPRLAVALEAAKLFGTCAAETNLASACKQAHQQAGHMCASDPIKLSLSTLVRRRPSTYAGPLPTHNRTLTSGLRTPVSGRAASEEP